MYSINFGSLNLNSTFLSAIGKKVLSIFKNYIIFNFEKINYSFQVLFFSKLLKVEP
jgi:hypothetical protein